MAGDWTQRRSVGDDFDPTAEWYNHVTEAAKAVLRGKNYGGMPSNFELPEGLIYVQNNSGDDCQDFDVLGIDSILFTPDQNLNEFKYHFAVKGVTPAAANHAGKFVITMEPIASGQLGRAFIAGVCPAYVNMQTSADKYADIDDGDSNALKSGSDGAAQILWAAGGTGEQWALVRLSRPALPAGTGQYKVLQLVDNLNPGTWGIDYPAFS